MSADLPRRLLAEGIGAGILLFGVGSVVAAVTLGDGALDYAGLGMVSITFGLVIALAIYGAVARPLAFEREPAQRTTGDIEGRRDQPGRAADGRHIRSGRRASVSEHVRLGAPEDNAERGEVWLRTEAWPTWDPGRSSCTTSTSRRSS